ncbi:MAG: hypothetical protein KKF62_19165 [Bacteroidetes bacterium]|nr:hypothetical protein [Bacteroidota bacterium]MBU1117023.1 hypothetical protein [Bacteroidota bacterium]MBU1797618.1 hypothetical protein [Bacteroidota bacterium]
MKQNLHLYFLAFIFLNFNLIFAQEHDSSEVDLSINSKLSEMISPSIFSISGDAGAYGELYSTSRDIARRPTSTGRLFLRPTFTFLNNFSISFDLFVSTEGNDARQQINRFALHPEWSWGKAHVGDFNHKFSDYSLNGINIRGGGVEINPGWFRFQAIGGQTRRSIVASPYSSVYSQNMGAIKIGIGNERTSFFDINIVLARDDSNSVPKSTFIVDTTGAGGNPQVGITPQENILLGFNTDLKILKNILRFRGEATASLFTQNVYADVAEIDGVPSFFNDLFTLRNSSNVDYAYKGALDFKYDFFNSSLKYEVINPGFRSLGMTSVINDKKKYGAMMGFRMFDNILTFQLRYDAQNDNLLNQKKFTLKRNTFGFNAVVRPIQSLSIMLNVIQNKMFNDSASDTLKIDGKVSTFATNLSYQFPAFGLRNSAMLGYSHQISTNYSFYLGGNNNITVKNIFGSISTTINQIWSVAPGFTAIVIDSWTGATNQTLSFNMRINGRFFQAKWNNALTVSMSNSDFTKVVQLNLQSDYRITNSDMLKLKVRYSLTNYSSGTLSNFWENIASLNYVHRL